MNIILRFLALCLFATACSAAEPPRMTHGVFPNGGTWWLLKVEVKALGLLSRQASNAQDPDTAFNEFLDQVIGQELSKKNLCSRGWRITDTTAANDIASIKGICL